MQVADAGSNPALLWLWFRLVATAPIRPLAWEPPYATEMVPEMAKKKKKIREKPSLTVEQKVEPTSVKFRELNTNQGSNLLCHHAFLRTKKKNDKV